MLKKVTMITITQLKRFNCLKILFMMIQKQTYQNIYEWVIVEGSQNKEDSLQNKQNIKTFIEEIKPLVNFKINYIEYSGLKLGGLRNIGNTAATGDIIVCLDDDDYYPPERITSAVDALNSSKFLIGGVSDVYLYDFFMDKLFKFKGFMEYHSTNNCMAYKREYLITHKHDPEIEVGEERSFTLEFKTPLVKIDSRKTIIAISHNFNTFNKRELCLGGTLKTLNTLTLIEEPITNYIDPTIYKKMKELYVIENKSQYDITYLVGGFSNTFDPKSLKLFEYERSLITLAEYWIQKNKSVIVYGEFNKDFIWKGVHYKSWKTFPYQDQFNILILYRITGLLTGIPFPIKATKIYWDVYDNFVGHPSLKDIWKHHGNKVSKIYLKSHFHKLEFEKHLGLHEDQEILIIPGGLRLELFSINPEKVERNPYRFCYTTHYDRGLEFLIKGVFSVIKKIEPRAELHVYGGMDMIQDKDYKNKMLELFTEHGVCEHGAQSGEIIAREKHLSSFELYISNIINEVDCLSIRESVVAGCIPLIANFGVFFEREGYHYDMNHEDPKQLQKVGLQILQLIKDQKSLSNYREEMKIKSKFILSWNQVGDIIYNSL